LLGESEEPGLERLGEGHLEGDQLGEQSGEQMDMGS
jgi:hypothetical protein